MEGWLNICFGKMGDDKKGYGLVIERVKER